MCPDHCVLTLVGLWFPQFSQSSYPSVLGSKSLQGPGDLEPDTSRSVDLSLGFRTRVLKAFFTQKLQKVS